jgi:ferredoxin-NADP reductase
MFPAGDETRESHLASGFDTSYLGRATCGDDVATLLFSRPQDYRFSAGQWFVLTLRTANGPLKETFSHSNAPSDEGLELTTRLTGSPYKRALAGLAVGDTARIAGPGGRLALPPDAPRVAFLAGGVGITPVRSLLRDAWAQGRTFDDALLLYGNRDESCIPFREEFEAMSDVGVRLVNVLENPTAQWTGERGFITADLVRRTLDSDDGRPFFVTGPPPMVTAMEMVLDDLGLAPDRRIVERFGTARQGA